MLQHPILTNSTKVKDPKHDQVCVIPVSCLRWLKQQQQLVLPSFESCLLWNHQLWWVTIATPWHPIAFLKNCCHWRLYLRCNPYNIWKALTQKHISALWDLCKNFDWNERLLASCWQTYPFKMTSNAWYLIIYSIITKSVDICPKVFITCSLHTEGCDIDTLHSNMLLLPRWKRLQRWQSGRSTPAIPHLKLILSVRVIHPVALSCPDSAAFWSVQEENICSLSNQMLSQITSDLRHQKRIGPLDLEELSI